MNSFNSKIKLTIVALALISTGYMSNVYSKTPLIKEEVLCYSINKSSIICIHFTSNQKPKVMILAKSMLINSVN